VQPSNFPAASPSPVSYYRCPPSPSPPPILPDLVARSSCSAPHLNPPPKLWPVTDAAGSLRPGLPYTLPPLSSIRCLSSVSPRTRHIRVSFSRGKSRVWWLNPSCVGSLAQTQLYKAMQGPSWRTACFSALCVFLFLRPAAAIRFVVDREDCFSHDVEYEGDTVHVSFVVIKADTPWHYSQEGVDLVVIRDPFILHCQPPSTNKVLCRLS
jgi:hypothetical protein